MNKQLKGFLITSTGAAMWGLNSVAGKFVMGVKDVDPVWMVTLRLILAIISSITCAMYTVLPGKLIKKYGTFAAVGWGMLLAGIIMIPVVKLWEVSGTWDISTVSVFGFVIIFGTVVAFAAFLYGITIVGPLTGSILGLIEPVVAALASAVILKQKFLVTDIIGIVAILGGVAMLSIYNEKKREKN